MRPISTAQRGTEALWPVQGLGSASGTGAADPGTTVTLESLGLAQQKLLTITPTAVNDFLYTMTIRFKGTDYVITYQADPSATVAEITAGLVSAANTALPADSVVAVDNTTDFTLETEVRGEDFDFYEGTNLAVVTTTAAIVPSVSRVKLWLVNTGSATIYLERDGEVILPVVGGAAAWEWVAPVGSDFAVVDPSASISFECYAVAPYRNEE